MKGWRDFAKNDPTRGEKIRFDRRVLRFLKNIKTWQLLLILLFFVLLAAIFLRLNSLGALDRYEALRAADKTGDVAKVQQAAADLQNYTAQHMNSLMPRVALQTLYNQAAQAAINQAKPPEISGTLYENAVRECASRYTQTGYQAWKNCIIERVGSQNFTLSDVDEPNPDAYYVEYVPARWSPDLAGFSVLICGLLIVMVAARLIMIVILRVILRFKYRAT